MHSFGFIGFGKMAQMLIHGLVNFAGVSPSSIGATRNDKERLNEISAKHKEIGVYENCRELAANSKCIFICAKPSEFGCILKELAHCVTPKNHIVSLAITVPLANITGITGCKATKLVPTLTSYTGEGVSLICHSSLVEKPDKDFLDDHLRKFCTLKTLTEKEISFASVLTSCAPGFIASIMEHFASASYGYTDSLGKDEIDEMVIETMYASAKLLKETDMDFAGVIKSVATKGGITQEGIAVFNNELPSVYSKVFENAYKKIAASETSACQYLNLSLKG